MGFQSAKLIFNWSSDIFLAKRVEEKGVSIQFCGRLGNHMFEYARCRIFAEENKLPWNLYSPLLKKAFPELDMLNGQMLKTLVPPGGPWYHQNLDDLDVLLSHREDLKRWFKPSSFGIEILSIRGWPVVVNVRGGDFIGLNWTVRKEYYHKCVENVTNFIVVTDDPPYSKGIFPRAEIIHCEDDFSVLYHSKTLISSNSTYCWWAGFLGNHDKVVSPSGHFSSKSIIFKWATDNLGWRLIS